MAKEYREETETFIRFQGRKYSRKSNGYYYNCSTRKHLHQAIWIAHNGPIPDGYEIHHKDLNKENNDISNLSCITKAEHHRIHNELLSEEDKQWRRNNFDKNARPAAIAWHKSEAGRQWHIAHAKQMVENGKSAFTKKIDLICTNCGKHYEGVYKSSQQNHFCSNACKSSYRRKLNKDNVDVVCPICKQVFKMNKYKFNKSNIGGYVPCSSKCRVEFTKRIKPLF